MRKLFGLFLFTQSAFLFAGTFYSDLCGSYDEIQVLNGPRYFKPAQPDDAGANQIMQMIMKKEKSPGMQKQITEEYNNYGLFVSSLYSNEKVTCVTTALGGVTWKLKSVFSKPNATTEEKENALKEANNITLEFAKKP